MRLEDRIHHPAKRALKTVAGAGRRMRRQPVRQFVELAHSQGVEDSVPIGKVLVQRPRADACPVGDSGRRGPIKALFDQNANGSIKDIVNHGARSRLLRYFSFFFSILPHLSV